MFMNPSFWIVPAFKNSRARSSRLGAGLQHKEVFGTDSIESTMKKEVRGAIKEGRDGGQNSGDAGGTHAAEITIPPFALRDAARAPTAKKKYAAAEKSTCSIEAMCNGSEYEAWQ